LVQSLITSQPIHFRCSRSKDQRSSSQRIVRHQH